MNFRIRKTQVGRFTVAGLFLAVALAFLLLPATKESLADPIHRNGFEGKQTAWVRGEDNVRAEERAHTISGDYAHQGNSSEHIQLICPEGKNDQNYVRYYYSTQPAPLNDELTISTWVKANRAGIRLEVRLVLPRERNPKQLDELMTVTLVGDTYQLSRRWQQLEINNPVKLAKAQHQVLRAQLRREIDFTDAYVDRIVLNLYTGPGQLDVYLDDLEVGPVQAVKQPPVVIDPKKGTPTGKGQPPVGPKKSDRALVVKMEGERLTVNNKAFFFRAIKHSKIPLKTLRDAGFNTVWFDIDTPSDLIAEAAEHGFGIVPGLPLLGDPQRLDSKTSKGSPLATARDNEEMGKAIARFLHGESVLFWDLGGALQAEKAEFVAKTARAVHEADPGRPRAVDVWDGFSEHTPTNIDLIGTHRFPLMTSLELTQYREWLSQRRRLTLGNTLHWTWIQTHVPDWQSKMLYNRDTHEGFQEPIGPQPEQIRLLTYLAIANGCRGLGYWSDRFLADSHQGRDRMLMMSILNQEIHMLEPLLMRQRDVPTWIPTSHPQVQAAVLRTELGIVVLPIWLGDGAQYVPPQGAVSNLSMTIDLVPEGSEPWEISPGKVQSLQHHTKRVLRGTRLTIPEFDLTAAVVFTGDLRPDGLVARWQHHQRKMARAASVWAADLAAIELQKVRRVHSQLDGLAPPVVGAERLLREAEHFLESARRHDRDGDDPAAHQDAIRALRPLRILMRAHWTHAVQTLDLPTASPYAVSFYTLPRHWELQRELQGRSLGPNMLPDGDFESPKKSPELIPIQPVSASKQTPLTKDLPGWKVSQQTLDEVVMKAQLVTSAGLKPKTPERPAPKREPYAPSTGREPERPEPPMPELGDQVLQIEIQPKTVLDSKKKAQPAPQALERTYLAVNSPAIQAQPSTWVRISGWVSIPNSIAASADGALLFDNVGGEALGVRLTGPTPWKRFRLYRKVPPNGAVWLTVGLTGIGKVYFDDLRIESLGAVGHIGSPGSAILPPPKQQD